MTTLYAWRTPAFWTDSPVDHTWVTTYDSQAHPYPDIDAVKAAGEDNFYCWGSFHPVGDPPDVLTSAPGNRALAQCLVLPNEPSEDNPPAQGTIFTYGIDGVCHQLTNQILYATGDPDRAPQTVKGARGYDISSFFYGTYGRQHQAWLAKIQACTGAAAVPPVSPEGVVPMTQPAPPPAPDEFATEATRVLEDDPEKLARLMELRAGAQAELATLMTTGAPLDAAAINESNQRMLDEAARILSAEEYRTLFGVAPGEKVELVDPAMVAAQRGQAGV